MRVSIVEENFFKNGRQLMQKLNTSNNSLNTQWYCNTRPNA